MRRSLTDCQNCNQRYEAQYPYCPYCGIKSKDELTLGVLFNNTISNYFSVDARFFKSFIPLMFKPGYLAKQFVDGRRLLYLHPAQIYLFISVVFFFLFSFISHKQAESVDSAIKKDYERSQIYMDSLKQKSRDSLAELSEEQQQQIDEYQFASVANQEHHKVQSNKGANYRTDPKSMVKFDFNEFEIDSMIAAGASDKEIYLKMGMEEDAGYIVQRFFKQILKFFKNKSAGSILQTFVDSIPLAMFILLPIFALILKLFYFRKGRFAYHLVFSFYFFSFLFAVFSLLVIANLIWEKFPGWIMTLVMFSTFFYLFFGVKRFYKQGYLRSFIKSSAVSFMFLAIVLPFAFMIMGLMAFLFY